MLQRAVSSVCRQSLRDFELIVVDDGSTEPCGDLPRDPRIRIIRNCSSLGVAQARNLGIEAARGKYISFLDDDDEFLSSFLSSTYTSLKNTPEEIGVSWCGVKFIDYSRDADGVPNVRIRKFAAHKNRQTLVQDFLSIGTGYGVTIKADCLRKVGPFNSALKVASDTDMFFRILVQGFSPLAVPGVHVVRHNHHGPRLTDVALYQERIWTWEQWLLRQYSGFLDEHPALKDILLVYVDSLKKKLGVARSFNVRTISQLYSRVAMAIHKRVAKVLSYGARATHRNASDGHFPGVRIGRTTKRRIHLTFDDGPHLVNTPKLLDELKQAGILATFFVVGKNLETPHGKEVLERAAAEGHQIGNHTYSHPHLTELNEDQIREEILKTENLIGGANKGIKIFRPPFGEHNSLVDQVAQELGYSLVLWNVDTLDWHPKYEGRWVKRAMEQIVTQEDSIVLAHDRISTTVAKVGSLITNIRKLSGSRFIQYSEAFSGKRSLPSRSYLFRQSGEI